MSCFRDITQKNRFTGKSTHDIISMGKHLYYDDANVVLFSGDGIMNYGPKADISKLKSLLNLERYDCMSADELLEELDDIKNNLRASFQSANIESFESSYIYGERMRYVVALLNNQGIEIEDIQVC